MDRRAIRLALALLAATLVPGCASESEEGERAGAGQLARGTWRALADFAPTRGGGLVGLRTDRDILILTGGTPDATLLAASAFDHGSRIWRQLRPSPLEWRSGYTAVWTGADAIIWGGAGSGGNLADGAQLNPVSGAWKPVPRAPLRPRFLHSAVWTGSEMIVWGGSFGDFTGVLSDGAAYNPDQGTWRRIAPSPLRARYRHAAVWTGTEMIVLGGSSDSEAEGSGEPQEFLADGAAYDPERDSWREIARAPLRNTNVAAVWTGTEMLAFDGKTMAAYDPESDTWQPLTDPPLKPRENFAAVWTGSEFLIWGGVEQGCGDCFLSDGAAYRPDDELWRRLPRAPLLPRDRHVAVWTGTEVLVWGGCCKGDEPFADGALYDPPAA